nr:unnamed protein product [Digitaria exilis]
MELAMATMGSLLPKLGVLLDEEYKLQNSVRRDFQYLQRELQSMHAALREVAEVAPEQLQQHDRLWAGDVRELSQDIEDVVDTFLVRIDASRSDDPAAAEAAAAAKPQECCCFRGLLVKTTTLLKKCQARHQIATAIKDIKDQVHEVANRDGRYRGPQAAVADLTAATTRVTTTTTVDPLLQALYGAKKNIVGIDDAKDEVICKLCQGDDDASKQQLKILSVVGFGGLGKTTLTKAVYDELRPQFECGAFVTVSRNPDVKKVLRDLLYELDNEKHKNLSGAVLLDERQLIDELRKSLENKSSSSLPVLSYLHINVREVWLEDIQTIGMLPALRFVCLRAGVEDDLATEQCDVEKFVLSAGAFPCARECVFLNVTMVPCNFPRGAMAMVQSLRFRFRVTDILSGDFDLSMSSLPSLEDLYIDYDMKKARREGLVRAQRMLSGALQEHPNLPFLHPDFPCEEEEDGVTAPGQGLGPSMASSTQLAGRDADGTSDGPADSIVQESSIPPAASTRIFCMLRSFIAETKLEVELIFSTRIFWYLLIGSLLLYGVLCSCTRR